MEWHIDAAALPGYHFTHYRAIYAFVVKSVKRRRGGSSLAAPDSTANRKVIDLLAAAFSAGRNF
jgi:hypothetical protein